MNLNEYADGGVMRNLVGPRSSSALKRNKQKRAFSDFYDKASLKRAWIKDIVVVAAAVLLLVIWILNYNSFDLVSISHGNFIGGSDIAFQGRGAGFHPAP